MTSSQQAWQERLFAGPGEIRALCRSMDWSATALGPAESWPQSLRLAVRMCLDARFPMTVWAGPELVLIYNEGYPPVLGPEKHPWALGRPAREVWAELWDRLGPELERVMKHGEPTIHDNERFLLRRGGPAAEESFFTYSFTPIQEADGRIVGALNVFVETTGNVRSLVEREAQYRALFESASDAIIVTDPSGTGRVVSANRAACRLFGYTEAEFRKVERATMVDPGDPELGRLMETRAKGGNAAAVLTYVRKDGTRFTGELRTTLFSDAHENKLAVAIIRDITERQRAEASLRESEERFRAVLENSLDAAYRRDLRSDEYDYLSPVIERITGYSVEEISSFRVEQVFALIHPEDVTGVKQKLRRLASGAGAVIEYRFRCKDGSYRWLADSAVIHPGPDGTPAYRAGTVRDISESKRTEAELREANARLVEADQRKTEFLAVLSHELRNPLAPIRNSVYILERATPGGEQAKRAREVIDRQAQHMARLIEDLLDVTRISRAKFKLQRERVDFSALVRGTAEDHREVFARHGVELRAETPSGPLWVDGDPTRLAQVIGNLLSNSAKFTPRGGRTLLSLGANANGEAVVRVRDSGAGMSRETLEHLFQPFMQAAQTIERTRGGLGLGLALVKGLVEMHGGTVSAHSAGEGKGSEFTVRVPLVEATLPLLGETPAQTRSSSGRRVLVIEDNVDAAESLREALELGGHEVAMAYSGPEGVEAARSYQPEVIFCDIGLPGMDGYGVARTLRAEPDPRLQNTFLVALSGYALQEDVARAKEAGFDRHLAKPPSMERLEKLLAEAPEQRPRSSQPASVGGRP